MPRISSQRRSRPKPVRKTSFDASRFGPWLTGAAFTLSLILVIVRAMMTETIRTGNVVAFSTDYAPVGPGPATSLLMDLLFCLPALLVLARRVIDPGYVLRLAWSVLPMALLAAWAGASVIWSDDKFSAAISAANWAAALVFIWSTSQLVRSWLRLRLVAGVCSGLLLVLIASGWYYRLIDWPDLKRSWAATSSELLGQMHKAPGSREAEQFATNIASGTPLGFSISTNTYGALLVLTMAVSTAVALQRRKDRDHNGWILPIAISLLPAGALLYFTHGKAVAVTAGLGAAAFVTLALLGDQPRRYARQAYFAGVGILVLGIAALVGHGLYHHSLPTSSLAFRWHYWVASARLFIRHPFIGVGWENFGPHYLAYRLPAAPEEIRDPHNFLVRAFVELGAIGGLLMMCWMLLLWWELAGPLPQIAGAIRQVVPGAPVSAAGRKASHGSHVLSYAKDSTSQGEARAAPTDSGYPAFAIVIALGTVAVGLNMAISFDWNAPGAFLIFEAFKRLMFLVFLLGGLLVAVLPSMTVSGLDDRPAPWILTGIRLALGLFLLHNLIEFSLFEPGAMSFFVLLTGSALGIRLMERTGDSPAQPSMARRGQDPRGRKTAVAALAAGAFVWLAATAALAAPIALAEGSAHDGDEQMRQASIYERKLEANGGLSHDTRDVAARSTSAEAAAADFEAALRDVPYNADYALRAAGAWRFAGWPDKVRPFLARAIAIDPSGVSYYLTRAHFELETLAGGPAPSTYPAPSTRPAPALNQPPILDDFRKALALDPNNVAARLDYAAALEEFGRKSEAADQYSAALWYDAQLSREENKRLPDQRVRDIEKHLNRLVGNSR